ncbi:DNA polymerase III subunit beta [Aminipila luticellarii]|uniref:Beta sliding clamp n=1 Tax=Aminipila luticellarii TaxID=2507160 RepID=A0A410PRW4_9FIRM|nr:DNA polymerase III subunit beta [Aminipila luticellarii]QAT41731.1 DNA polymerase III subunit beta [Aminipila luticellarii]
MKFTCNQQILSKAINTVSKAVTNRTTIPILKGILLRAKDNTLTLTASDLDLSIEKIIETHVSEEGETVVLSRLFSEIIRKLPNEEITVELKEDNNLTIECSSSQFNIVCFPADEFPNIGEIEEKSKLVLNRELFKEMIRKTSFAASLDESKGVIVGVLIELEENSLNMIALDGFRMAVVKEDMKNSEEKKIIIASKILSEISKIISEVEDENVGIILDNKKAVVILEGTRIVLRLLEGEFIKYKDILPKECKTTVTLNKGDFLESIERASLFAKEGKNNLVKLSISGNDMTITSRSEEGNVKENVMISTDGEGLDIGFNSKYLIDVLKVIEEDEIKLELNTGVSPCLVKPIEGNQFVYLILPVRLSGN